MYGMFIKEETNGVNNKKANNGMNIMPLFPRYDKIQMELIHKNRLKQAQPW